MTFNMMEICTILLKPFRTLICKIPLLIFVSGCNIKQKMSLKALIFQLSFIFRNIGQLWYCKEHFPGTTCIWQWYFREQNISKYDQILRKKSGYRLLLASLNLKTYYFINYRIRKKQDFPNIAKRMS